MVTDLCQSLGSGNSLSLLVYFIGETGWLQICVSRLGTPVLCVCVFLLGGRMTDLCQSLGRQFCVFMCVSIREAGW